MKKFGVKEIEALPKVMELAEKWYPDKKLKHAIRVACYACSSANKIKGIDPIEAYIVGIAHDLIEDTECPQDELQDAIGSSLFRTVLDLTKEDDETYADYIQSILNIEDDDLVFHVKKADMKDHMAQTETLTDKLKDKYLPVLHYFL